MIMSLISVPTLLLLALLPLQPTVKVFPTCKPIAFQEPASQIRKLAGSTNTEGDTKPVTVSDPLLRLLVSKGLLTGAEAQSVITANTPQDQRNRRIALLKDKGVLSIADVDALRTSTGGA